MKISLLSLAVITCMIITSFGSCKKHTEIIADNPFGLPNATANGSNIFACRINDSNWIVKLSIFNLGSSFLRNNNRDTFSLSGSGAPNRALSLISFVVFDKIKTGSSYKFIDTNKAIVNTFRQSANCGPTIGYGGSQWNKAIAGNITITKFTGTYSVPSCCTYGTYDKEAIIAGTFDFVIAIPNCDSIKVTNGRFDINYSQY